MPSEFETSLQAAINAILLSASTKRLVSAGPGTGKTTTFRLLLQREEGTQEQHLVLTFIKNLKAELDEKLGDIARVFTFHGYCYYLLKNNPRLRTGLTDQFRYFPSLPTIIKSDWVLIRGDNTPKFIEFMRAAQQNRETEFYFDRADYYDAVGYDDSVFRSYCRLAENSADVESYAVVLVDEYQDFNRLEALFIDLLSASNRILIAGDDDQALYSQLRGSSADFIRGLYLNPAYEKFDLPYCQRCTEVVIQAFHDVVCRATQIGKLQGRIDKRFLFYPPRKSSDSTRYPKIRVVETSVQNNSSNYFGRYIAEVISRISPDEVMQSVQERFPTVLIIGPGQYLRQVYTHLISNGYSCEAKESSESANLDRQEGIQILRENPSSNLGWRIVLEFDEPPFMTELIRQTDTDKAPLCDRIPHEYKERIIAECAHFSPEEAPETEEAQLVEQGANRPTIKLTSFEGAKGLSAQHVFVIGLHNGDLPRLPQTINDLEICKFLVALTRTRKQCYLIYTRRWGAQSKLPSVFINWIQSERKQRVRVDRHYWSSSS